MDNAAGVTRRRGGASSLSDHPHPTTDPLTTEREQANADGRARAARRDWTSAEQAFRRAATAAEQAGDLTLHATALRNVGHAQLHRGAVEDAQRTLRESLAVRETLAARGEPAGLALALNDLGVALSSGPITTADHVPEVQRLFARAIDLAESEPDAAAAVARNAARACLAAYEPEAAEPFLVHLAAWAEARGVDAGAWRAAADRVRASSVGTRLTSDAREAALDAAADDLVFLPLDDADDQPGTDAAALVLHGSTAAELEAAAPDAAQQANAFDVGAMREPAIHAVLGESEHHAFGDAHDIAPAAEPDMDLGFPADDMPHVELPLIAMDDADDELPLLETVAVAEGVEPEDDALEFAQPLAGLTLIDTGAGALGSARTPAGFEPSAAIGSADLDDALDYGEFVPEVSAVGENAYVPDVQLQWTAAPPRVAEPDHSGLGLVSIGEMLDATLPAPASAEPEPSFEPEPLDRVRHEVEVLAPHSAAVASRATNERMHTPPPSLTVPAKRAWWKRFLPFGRG
jgi:hypothetical protein